MQSSQFVARVRQPESGIIKQGGIALWVRQFINIAVRILYHNFFRVIETQSENSTYSRSINTLQSSEENVQAPARAALHGPLVAATAVPPVHSPFVPHLA